LNLLEVVTSHMASNDSLEALGDQFMPGCNEALEKLLKNIPQDQKRLLEVIQTC